NPKFLPPIFLPPKFSSDVVAEEEGLAIDDSTKALELSSELEEFTDVIDDSISLAKFNEVTDVSCEGGETEV
ncbi:unnamed protein product, partial [Prunus brigantina]